MSLRLPGCWQRTPASCPPGPPPARSSPRLCGPLLTPCPRWPGRLTGCVPEAAPSAATENRTAVRGLALGGPQPTAGPGSLQGGGFPARPDDARGRTGRVTVPRRLPLMLERPKGVLRKPTLFWSCRAFTQPENEEMVHLFGNGASSEGTLLFCLPATLGVGKGRESDGGRCPGAAGPRGSRRQKPWTTPSGTSLSQDSAALLARCHSDLVPQAGGGPCSLLRATELSSLPV